MAVTILTTASIATFAQKDDPPPEPTVEDAQKVVQAISSDKDKLQAYCELGKLQEQMEEAESKKDTKTIDELIAKADSLEQQVGPDYSRLLDGLDQLDPNSAEGQKYTAVFDTLQEKCK
jgi:mevalonate kinase